MITLSVVLAVGFIGVMYALSELTQAVRELINVIRLK